MTGLQARLAVARGDLRLELALEVAPGEVVALLGPNGAGKSTTLRALAGLLAVDEGRVELAGRVLADAASGVHLPPAERGIGVVFQDYLLFPHLSVLDNVAFGPRACGRSAADARRQAMAMLDRLGIAALSATRPGRISGGQAQRVALARALVTEPGLLLLDEPLAALDARTRLLVRAELRRSLADFTGATVVVTHDPVDAAVLADRLVVVEAGRVVQQGSPAEVARRPRTDYVARLVGLNLLRGRAAGLAVELVGGGAVQVSRSADGDVYASFRPAAVSLFTARPAGSPRNLWRGRVQGLEPHGEGVRVEVADVWDQGSALLAEVTQAAVVELGLLPGAAVWASVKASEVEVYPA